MVMSPALFTRYETELERSRAKASADSIDPRSRT